MDKKAKRLRRTCPGLLTLAILCILSPVGLQAQFEQMLSLNVSAGYFNTIGWSGWEENWEDHGPSLMPNFKGGPAVTAGLQYNFSRHFSVEFQLGFSFAPGWYFDASPESVEAFNYLHYEIHDELAGAVLAEGDNYMDLSNMHMGIAPRYYFIPGSRLNPFVYAGLSLNYMDVYFDNLEYKACEDLGRPDLYQENPELSEWFDYHVGIGMMAGAGVEYVLNDSWGFFMVASYHFVPLSEETFYGDSFLMNYHDLAIQLGARISFLKSRIL